MIEQEYPDPLSQASNGLMKLSNNFPFAFHQHSTHCMLATFWSLSLIFISINQVNTIVEIRGILFYISLIIEGRLEKYRVVGTGLKP